MLIGAGLALQTVIIIDLIPNMASRDALSRFAPAVYVLGSLALIALVCILGVKDIMKTGDK